MNKEIIKEFVEKGANLEHDRWAKWQKYMHSRLQKDHRGFYWLDDGLFEHWERQIATPYSELSEAEKESDREETRNYIPLLEKALKSQRQETIEEMIKLSDDIELKISTPDINEWRAFKLFRNKMRDKIKQI